MSTSSIRNRGSSSSSSSNGAGDENKLSLGSEDNDLAKVKKGGSVTSSYIYHRNIIIKVALISRLFIWFYSFGVTQLMSAFDSSADLNSLTPSVSSSTLHNQQQQLSNHNNTWIEKTIKRVFVKWDSVYYTRIAEYGYEYEQYHAFFPLYPLATRYTANLLSFLTNNYLVVYSDYIILAGFIVSNLSFILSAIQLLKLGNIVFNNQKISFVATLLYCINPASVFMAAVYTESTFNLFVFAGLYYLYGGRFYLNPTRVLGLDNIPLRRDVLSSTIGAILFGCATAGRSNGILLCGFIIYYHNATLFTKIFRRIFILLNSITQKRRSSPVLTHSTSFGKISEASFNLPSFIARLLLSTVQSAIVITPYILFQYYGYQRYCLGDQQEAGLQDKFGEWPREWCKSKNLYSFVQNYYWDQGFFNYYTVQQIPNFALATPMVVLSACSVVSFLCFYMKNPYDMSNTIAKLRLKNKINLDRSPYYNSHLVPFVVHLGFLTIFSVTFMHVQVITRFFTHSPLVFWFAAKFFVNPPNHPTKLAILSKQAIFSYFLLYTLLGCILFPNFYPWT